MRTRSHVRHVAGAILAAACILSGCSKGEPPLQVHLRDGVSGKAIAGAPVTWCFTEPDPETGALRRFNEASASTDAQGACTFPTLPPDRAGTRQDIMVEAKAEGFCIAAHIDSFTFRDGKGLVLDLGALPLWTEGTVTGRVVDAASGAPLAQASLLGTATRIPESPAEQNGDPRYLNTAQYQAITGEGGTFEMKVDHFALDRDSYWLTIEVKKDGYTYAVQDLGAAREVKGRRLDVNYARIHCDTWLSRDADSSRVTGRALDPSGKPLAGADLMVAGVKYFNTCPRGCHGGEPHPVVIEPVVTDPEGRFGFWLTAPYLYGLAHGIRVARGGDFQYWRTPLATGTHEGEHRFEFADGATVELSVRPRGD